MPSRLSIVTLEGNRDMCQSSLVDEKAENITKGLSDIKKTYQGTKKKSKTFHLREVDLDIVTVPPDHIFPIFHTTVELTQLNHGQQPSFGTPRLTLANPHPILTASVI